MDRAPPDVLRLIISKINGYRPVLRAVCRAWKAVLASMPQQSLLTAVDLASSDQYQLLAWAFAHRLPPKWVAYQMLVAAARVGSVESLKVIRGWHVAHTASVIDDVMFLAAKYNQAAVLRLCMDWGGARFDAALCGAAAGGHAALLVLAKDRGATNFGDAARKAAAAGHLGIVRTLLDWGPEGADRALCAAARCGHEAIMRLCKDRGATDFNTAMLRAAQGDYEDLVCLCIDWGATRAEATSSLLRADGELLALDLLLGEEWSSVGQWRGCR